MSLLDFMQLFPEFRGRSWDGWRRHLARLTPVVREWFAIVGRGAGKSRIVALLACYFAAKTYDRVPGESIYIGVFAPDRKQAGVTFRYVVGMLKSVPSLMALIVAETRDSVELSNGVIVEVVTASTAAPRGRAYALAIVEEAAFLPTDESANPDVELLRALRPALARVPGSLLAVVSSPYARRGVLWDASLRPENDEVVVVQAPTGELNPLFDVRAIARAYEGDPVAAASEYGAQFRADVSSLLLREAIAAVTPEGVTELQPEPGAEVRAHFDGATGSGEDAAALAVAYVGVPARLACVRRWQPPFSPSDVAAEAAALLRRYGTSSLTVDAFAPGLVADLFRRHGVECVRAEGDTSQAFVSLLALVNSRACALLDEPVLVGELGGLERRTSSGGRDRVGHAPRGHDDVAAACAFALAAAAHDAEEVPLMLVGSPTWHEWHGISDDNDDEVFDVAPGPDIDGPLAKVKRSASRLLGAAINVVSGDPAKQAERERRRQERRTARAVAERDRREAEQRDYERMRADAAAQQLTTIVRARGSWFPHDYF